MKLALKRLLCLILGAALLINVNPRIFAEEDEMKAIALPNGDFELGDTSGWELTGLSETPVQDQWDSNKTFMLDLWASDEEAVEVEAAYAAMLTAGTYYFTYDVSGQEIDSQLGYTISIDDEVAAKSDETVATTGWNNWQTLTTKEFTLTEDSYVTFAFGGTGPVGYWGKLDNLKLYGTGELIVDGPEIYVPKLEGVESDDFIRGTDVSAVLANLNSGATYYDFEGNELDGQGFFNLLKESGFNWIRLRVWNDPYDSEGHGYGGGNCDVNAAVTMGKWATNAGMKVLIDFHYSDFWADPGKQMVPKAWKGFNTDQKAEALGTYTYESLKTLLEAGVDVGMVQLGNETNNSIIGESVWSNGGVNGAKLIKAGADATRRIAAEFEHEILVAVHQANPNNIDFSTFVKNLKNNGVDIDVFGSSYYPFWHGTLENLTNKLKNLADTYGIKTYVAETSWPWTLEDGDGHTDNIVTQIKNNNPIYEFSIQGQADELVAVTKAVLDVGDAGMGLFLWENAWIPVEYAYDEDGKLVDEIYESNKAKWEEFGSGWASSYAAEYDPNDAGRYYGGSAIDNQANFDFDGFPMDSLNIFKYMMTGEAETIEIEVTSIDEPTIEIEAGETLTLPDKVTVYYNVGGKADEAVTWDEEDVAAVDTETPGTYYVSGVVQTQVGEEDVTLTVIVKAKNLLLNPSFELSDMSMYTYSGGNRSREDPHSGSYGLHFWNSNAVNLSAAQTVALEPGTYTYSLYAQGGDIGADPDLHIFVRFGDEELTETFELTGWQIWAHPAITFTVEEATDVTVGVVVVAGGGAWGTIDDLYLSMEPGEEEEDLDALIEEALALNPLDYTGASWAVLAACLEDALAGEGDAELLRYAIDNLEKKSEAMALGSDISAAAFGDREYRDAEGNDRKLYDIITNDYGYNMVRLRTWTGDEDGSCGKNTIIAYAKKCYEVGLRVMIDFHYADSWADPGQQPAPAAWNVTDDTSPEEADRVAKLLYDYTYDFISSMVAEGVYPEWVQVGNEINGGMVWPLGRSTNMDNFVKLLQAGTDAVRAASPTTKIVIHRSSGAETENCINFYQSLIDNGYDDFDIIGLSFYPYDMDPTYMLDCLQNTFDALYEDFCKDTHREIMLTEIGSNYMQSNGGATRVEGHNMIVNTIKMLQAIPDGRGTGCMYWEIENYEYQRRVPTVVWKAFSPGEELIIETLTTDLALSDTELSLEVGDAYALRKTYTPAKPDITRLEWKSSDPEVATIASNGLIVALKVGETEISATTTDGSNITAVCKVTVTPPVPGLKNGGFELGDKYWVIDKDLVGSARVSDSDNHLDGAYSLHYAASSEGLDIGFTQAIEGLEPGIYTLSCRVMGDSRESTGYLYANSTSGEFRSDDFQTRGWTSDASGWITVTLADITVGKDGNLLVGAKVTSTSSGAWGDFDNFTLVMTESLEDAVVTRVYGSDRYRTSFASAETMKEVLGVEKFEAVVVANGTDFKEPLVGNYLAAVKKAPLLLTNKNNTPTQRVLDYIKANLAEGGIVYVLGDDSSVPEKLEDGLEDVDCEVIRLEAMNFHKTNIAILKEAGVAAGANVLIGTEENFPDSLAASATGKPILLVGSTLDTAQKSYLKTLKKKGVTFTILGSESAVSADIETALKTYGEVDRLAGADRYDTALQIAQKYFNNPKNVVMVYGQSFPDGLSAGPLAFVSDAPILMARQDGSKYNAYARDYMATLKIKKGYVSGSAELVSDATAAECFKIDAADIIVKLYE